MQGPPFTKAPPASKAGYRRMGGGRSWSFRDGALVGTTYGTIGRDMKLTDMSDIEFDVVHARQQPVQRRHLLGSRR